MIQVFENLPKNLAIPSMAYISQDVYEYSPILFGAFDAAAHRSW